MKPKLSYLLFLIGAFSLGIQFNTRISREKQILETQLKSQQNSVLEGLKVEWAQYLLTQVKTGIVKEVYSVRMERSGQSLVELFSPQFQIQEKWSEYRKFKKEKNSEAQKTFLKRALNRTNSWDRILAIPEWLALTSSHLEPKTKFEETLTNPESREAYKRIFSFIAEKKDLTEAESDIQYDVVFYYLNNDNRIILFVPSAKEVEEKILPEFLKTQNLFEGSLGKDPWDITFPGFVIPHKISRNYELIWLSISIGLLLAGVILFLLGVRDSQTQWLRKVSFLNQVVHELKTPLTGIKLHLQLIEKGLGKEGNFKSLNQSLDRLNTLFDDIVLMNRPPEEIEIQSLAIDSINNVLEELKREFPDFKWNSTYNGTVVGELSRVRTILRNLVKNAIRYGKTAELQITYEGTNVQFMIQDQGNGIPESERELIFGEFYRSEEGKSLNADGLGLGLFICRKLAGEMKSEVFVSNSGKPGAHFVLKMPRGPK